MSALLPVYPRLDLELVRAQGATLHTADGRAILDLYGAHAVCPLGHAHPAVVEALSAAVRTLDFYSNSLHMPVQERAARAVLGDDTHLAYVHFVSSGAEANESALHLARRITGRPKVVTLDTSFHGRTLGVLSVTGLPGYRKRVPIDIPADWHATMPLGANDLAVIDETVAAVLVESVVSLGGVYLPPDGWLDRVQARCREVGALFILDEVQGGVGRLGTWFGHETLGSTPDIVTLAKSLGNGYPVAACVTTAEVGDAIGYGELGTTFGGGPMACAAISAVLEAIRDEGLLENVRLLSTRIRESCRVGPVTAIQGAGFLLGLVCSRPAREVQALLLEQDILAGTSADPRVLRLLPPYILEPEHVDRLAAALAEIDP